MAIKIEFTKEELHLLWHTACPSFVVEQLDRFDVIVPKGLSEKAVLHNISDTGTIFPSVGTLVFFESFLEAKLFQAAYTDIYQDRVCYLLFDSVHEQYGAWLEADFEEFNAERES